MNAPLEFRPDELRQPPAAVESEQVVIGAVLVKPESLAEVSDWLAEDDFTHPLHRAIWRTVLSLAAAGKPIDAILVAEHMEQVDEASSFDVLEIASSAYSAANIVAHAEIVLEKSRLRKFADLGARIAGAALRGDKGSADLAAELTHAMSGLQVSSRGGLQPIKPALKRFYEDLARRYESGERMYGRATPWRDVNELTHGLRGGELIVVAARPGMGKSVMGFRLASFDAMQPGGRVALFSLEMTVNEFAQREVAAIGNVPHKWLRAPDKGGDSAHHWTRVTDGVSALMQANVLVDDTPALTVAQIAARARRAHLQSPLSMVVVDHLHIVRIKGDNPVRELGDVSRGLKALAKELNVPVVALAQLNRGNTTRSDKRPVMADLRASGEIEQDADYIFLIHRPDYYDEDHDTGVVEVIVGKGRNVQGKTITLKNRLDVMRFDDWEGPLPGRKEKTRGGHRGFDA